MTCTPLVIRSTGIYVPPSQFSVSELAGKRSWTLASPFYIWIASCFCYSVQLLDPQDSRKECYHPPLVVPHADCLQMSAICLSHRHSKRGGGSPKSPEVGRTAALSRELQAETKCMEGSSPQNWSQKEFTLDKLSSDAKIP